MKSITHLFLDYYYYYDYDYYGGLGYTSNSQQSMQMRVNPYHSIGALIQCITYYVKVLQYIPITHLLEKQHLVWIQFLHPPNELVMHSFYSFDLVKKRFSEKLSKKPPNNTQNNEPTSHRYSAA